MYPNGTHFTAESNVAMRIKCLAQGQNILMLPGFKPTTSVSRNIHHDHMTNMPLMQMMQLNERIDQMARANNVLWNGHALRKDKNNFLRRALDFEVKWTRKRGRPKKTRLKAVVEQSNWAERN